MTQDPGLFAFAVFKTENAAKKGLVKIKKKYPKFWVWLQNLFNFL